MKLLALLETASPKLRTAALKVQSALLENPYTTELSVKIMRRGSYEYNFYISYKGYGTKISLSSDFNDDLVIGTRDIDEEYDEELLPELAEHVISALINESNELTKPQEEALYKAFSEANTSIDEFLDGLYFKGAKRSLHDLLKVSHVVSISKLIYVVKIYLRKHINEA
jgi:hypothetical protein